MSVGGGILIRILKVVAAAALAATALTLVTPMVAQAGDVEYGYDSAGRLVSARYPNDTLVLYTYDNAGNRTRRLAESCVGPELAPDAVNDTMIIYHGNWWNEETQLYWHAYAGVSGNLLANDTDPSSYTLHIQQADWQGETSPGSYTVEWVCEGFECEAPPSSFNYTVTNQHCQTDSATVSISIQPWP